MTCSRCGFEQSGDGTECIKCGVVFAKHLKRKRFSAQEPGGEAQTLSSARYESRPGKISGRFRELLFRLDSEAGIFSLAGRTIILAVLFFWGLRFVFSSVPSNYAGESFLHLVNLPFHEAGHVFFRIFGRFMMMLGGSLTQLLAPFICLLALLFKTKDPFGASVCLWWLGENFIDLAPYINDARDLNLILLGGVTGKDVEDFHDWEFILRKLGLLNYDHFLAKASHLAGALLITCAVAWGASLLFKQFRHSHNVPTGS